MTTNWKQGIIQNKKRHLKFSSVFLLKRPYKEGRKGVGGMYPPLS